MSSVNGIYGKLLSWGVEESRWFKLCQQLLSAIALCFPPYTVNQCILSSWQLSFSLHSIEQ